MSKTQLSMVQECWFSGLRVPLPNPMLVSPIRSGVPCTISLRKRAEGTERGGTGQLLPNAGVVTHGRRSQ